MKIRYRIEPRWGKPPLVVLQVETTEEDRNSGASFTSWRDAVPEDLFPEPAPLVASPVPCP